MPCEAAAAGPNGARRTDAAKGVDQALLKVRVEAKERAWATVRAVVVDRA